MALVEKQCSSPSKKVKNMPSETTPLRQIVVTAIVLASVCGTTPDAGAVPPDANCNHRSAT
jgi:hypothetical protein